MSFGVSEGGVLLCRRSRGCGVCVKAETGNSRRMNQEGGSLEPGFKRPSVIRPVDTSRHLWKEDDEMIDQGWEQLSGEGGSLSVERGQSPGS
jgi:hypothetical protein